MSIEVRNTAGVLISNVSDLTIDSTTVPSVLIGKGYPGWGKYNNENHIALLENFAYTSAPSNPLEGMFWYNSTSTVKEPSYWDGSNWIKVPSQFSSAAAQLTRLSGADALDFTQTGAIPVHTGAANTKSLVTSMMLIPRSGAAPTGAPAIFVLEISTGTGDVSDPIVLSGLSTASVFASYQISGVNRIVGAGETVSLNVKTAAGGTLDCDVYLFGKVIRT